MCVCVCVCVCSYFVYIHTVAKTVPGNYYALCVGYYYYYYYHKATIYIRGEEDSNGI